MKSSKRSARISGEILLGSYKTTMEALAEYLGEAYEIVLHDLRDLDHSVVKIMNGFHSGRKEGSPITDLALSMLKKTNRKQPYRVYHSKSKKGKPVRSTTMIIYGDGDEPVGMMCINLYLDSPLSSFLHGVTIENKLEYASEQYTSYSDELIMNTLEQVKQQVNADDSIPASLKNKEILRSLSLQGIFKLKKAIDIAAGNLGLSKNTVYLHIRDIEKH